MSAKSMNILNWRKKAICHTVSLDNSITVVFFNAAQSVNNTKIFGALQAFLCWLHELSGKVSSVSQKFSRTARLSMIQERIGKFKTTFIVNFEDRLFSSIGASSTRPEWNPLTANILKFAWEEIKRDGKKIIAFLLGHTWREIFRERSRMPDVRHALKHEAINFSINSSLRIYCRH